MSKKIQSIYWRSVEEWDNKLEWFSRRLNRNIGILFVICQDLDDDVRSERQMILNKSAPVSSAVVVVQDLVQQFKKRKENSFFQQPYTAVNHLNFYASQGSCFGLLGTNGAGKTTTFRVLINDIQPTSGQINIKKLVSYWLCWIWSHVRDFSHHRTIQKSVSVRNSIG